MPMLELHAAPALLRHCGIFFYLNDCILIKPRSGKNQITRQCIGYDEYSALLCSMK